MELHFSIKEIATSFVTLFIIIDVLGSIPIIVNIRNRVGHIQSERATLVAGILLICFLFFGTTILSFIGIDVQSFAVAGSLVLFIIALELILGIEIHKNQDPTAVSIVPIAFPLIAGAGSLTAVLSLRAEYHVENILVSIVLNMIIVYLVLKFAGKLENILGPTALAILKKVFGIILLAVSVKIFTSNIGSLFN